MTVVVNAVAVCVLLRSYTKPFDRHDWFVVGSDGAETRYVIDYYPGAGAGNGEAAAAGGSPATAVTPPPNLSDAAREPGASSGNPSVAPHAPPSAASIFVDVRPAIDSPKELLLRMHMQVCAQLRCWS